jgi:hypothetical protein
MAKRTFASRMFMANHYASGMWAGAASTATTLCYSPTHSVGSVEQYTPESLTDGSYTPAATVLSSYVPTSLELSSYTPGAVAANTCYRPGKLGDSCGP